MKKLYLSAGLFLCHLFILEQIKKVLKKKNRPEKIGFSFYLNRQKSIPWEMSLPDKKQELPVDEWIMPVQPQGYIKCRHKDFL